MWRQYTGRCSKTKSCQGRVHFQPSLTDAEQKECLKIIILLATLEPRVVVICWKVGVKKIGSVVHNALQAPRVRKRRRLLPCVLRERGRGAVASQGLSSARLVSAYSPWWALTLLRFVLFNELNVKEIIYQRVKTFVY